jgi:FtsH-binding integral membrane protein
MMIVAKIFFTVLEVMFAVGVIGSLLVVLLTSIDDVKELVEEKKPETLTVSSLQHSTSEAR